jgi:MYXO-CTERM domain-containing protein
MRHRHLAAAAILLVPVSAHAHGLAARVSPSGVDFLAEQLPTYVPTHLNLPPITQQVADPCPGATAITWTQQDTALDLQVDAFALSLPSAGALRVDLTVSAWASGTAYIDNPYACFGSATCGDDLSVLGANASIDFDVWVDAAGAPRVTVANVYVGINPDDVSFQLYDCAIDSLVNLVVDLGKDYIVDMITTKIEDLAREQLAPKLEGMLAGFAHYDGSVGSAGFDVRLTGVDIMAGGIELGADVDLSSDYPAAACIGGDPGDPGSQAGAAPNLAAGTETMVAASINLGLIDDALYHVWREGFLCVTPETLHAFGVDLDLSAIGLFIPNLPVGTTFSFSGVVGRPPRVEASPSQDAEVTLIIEQVQVDMTATFPDGTQKSMHIQTDVRASATAALDPGANALTLHMGTVDVANFALDEDLGLQEGGLDVSNVESLMEDYLMPRMLAQYGELPVSGAIFGGLAGYYVIPRELRTAAGYVIAKADLFRAPAFDPNAPDTFFDEIPGGVVNPKDAMLRVSGTDAEVPAELLKYQVRVDGIDRDPTWVREFAVGRYGFSGPVVVEVRAIDLAGNEDATPARTQILVDGIKPSVRMIEQPVGVLDTAAPHFSFEMSDDLTAAGELVASVSVVELGTGTGGEPIYEDDLAAGATEGTLRLAPGKQYRATLTVTDQAGNHGTVSFAVQVSNEAEPLDGGCGCRVGGGQSRGGQGAGAALVLLVGLAVVRRRRRTA